MSDEKGSAKTAAWAASLLCFLFMILSIGIVAAAQEGSHELAQIVFVSCNKHDRDQNYWDVIAATVEHGKDAGQLNKPLKRATGSCAANSPVDALVWLGDAVYADNFSAFRGCYPNTDLELVRSRFTKQRNASEYVAFRQTCVRQRQNLAFREDGEETQFVMGVWDDHDMGKNDGGAEYADKDATQQFFLDFLGVAKNSPRRKQKGVYVFETVPFRALDSNASVNPAKSAAIKELHSLYDHAVCFLLLDARYFREPSNATRSGDMLGEVQWKWLEERLRNDVAGQNPVSGRERCALTIVGSGVQVIMDEKVTESWGAFPLSRNRLFLLLRRYKSERVIFISGDVHLGEIGMDNTQDAMEALGYPILEATSSGLTHSSAVFWGLPTLMRTLFPSPRRVGVYIERNFGVVRLTADPEALIMALKRDGKAQRHQFERYINVSVFIHSIPQKGKAVLQLSLPLDVFTIDGGGGTKGRFNTFTSAVKRTCEDPSKENTENGDCSTVYYPRSAPLPVFTSLIQFLQRHIWPQHTLLQVVSTVVSTSVLLLLAATAVFCIRLWNTGSKRKKGKKLADFLHILSFAFILAFLR
ncbi:alkaline phosphatase [Trypanosoma cruzi]|nr:alkaline phosphatase [Trypanosoma cruzi]